MRIHRGLLHRKINEQQSEIVFLTEQLNFYIQEYLELIQDPAARMVAVDKRMKEDE